MTIPSVTNSAVSDTTLTLTISSASDRVIIFFGGGWDATAGPYISSVTFDSGGGDEASFTNEASSNIGWFDGLRYLRHEIWYLVLDDGVSSGDYTIDMVVETTTWNRYTFCAWEVADADTTDPIGASGTNNGDTDTPTVDVTTTAANSLVGMGTTVREALTFTAGSGDTEETEMNASQGSQWSGYTPASSTGTYTVSCTSSASPTTDLWVASAVEIFEAAGAGRSTYNTDSNPLGVHTGMGWRVNTP